MRARAVAAATLAVGLLGACTKSLDATKLETALKTDIEKHTRVDIRSVTCPTGVQAEKGRSFTCVYRGADGTRHHIRITQTDGNGHVTYEVTD